MEINQVYRAPSIPKLSTRNISSSVLRASSAVSSTISTPKLRTSRFGFFRPKPQQNLEEKLEVLKSEKVLEKNQNRDAAIYKALAETNQILVEIQKQLSADFAMRIAQEKETIKKVKAAESKRKFAAKEKSVEGVQKFGAAANNVVGRVAAPIKSVFDKIKEFFGLILTGIVTNAAFTWLADENNRKTLTTIFDWVGKIFVGLLIGVIVGKTIKWINRIFKVIKFLWRLPGRIGKLFSKFLRLPTKIREALGFKSKTSEVPKPSAPKPISGSSLSRANESFARFIQGQSNIGDRLRLFRRGRIDLSGLFTKGGFTPEGTLKGKFKPPSIPKVSPGSLVKGGTSLGLSIGLEMLGKAAVKKLTDPMIEKTRKDTVDRINSYSPEKRTNTIERIQNDLEKEKKYQSSPQHSLEKIINLGDRTQSEIKTEMLLSLLKDLGETPRYAMGGTVPGKGSGFVDSVRAMLAPGEEVIKTTSAMLFRPLLKDINDNAGRLWTVFSQAVKKLISVSDKQNEVSEQFSKVIKDFDRFVQNEIDKLKTSGRVPISQILGQGIAAGGPRYNTSPKSTVSKVTTVSRTVSSVPSSSGGMTFLPMVLPTQKSAPPQIPTPQTTATDVPFVSSVNMANPYMTLAPEIYGIFV